MKKAIRCCISCILPCGVLDVVRIVHSNGRVEELSGTIRASEIMKAYPKHVLKKPSSPSDDGVLHKIVVVPPDAQLQRGKIYFLIPVPPEKPRPKSSANKKKRKPADSFEIDKNGSRGNSIVVPNLSVSDRYLSEILSEKLSTQKDRRRGRVAVWRPHLESICESPADD